MGYKIFVPSGSPSTRLYARVRRKLAELIALPEFNELKLWRLVSNGIPSSAFKVFLDAGYKWQELEWIISRRKLQQLSAGSTLNETESNKTFRMLNIHALALEVLESDEKVIAWIHSPRSDFDGLPPLEFVKLECGAPMVEGKLHEIHANKLLALQQIDLKVFRAN